MHLESADFDFTRADTTLVIAEVGVNHNGDVALARRMVDVARDAGADIVKFQAFRSEKEISRYAPKAARARFAASMCGTVSPQQPPSTRARCCIHAA